MFSKLMKRSNAVWLYSTGRFAEERPRFLFDLEECSRSGWHMLRQTNRLLLAIAKRLNVRQRMPVTEQQIVQAAGDWVSKTCSARCTDATLDTATKRFIFVAKRWLHFLGKWDEPDRTSQFKPELESFLKELRDQRGYSPETISTRNSALNLFFEWLGKLGISLKELSPKILAAYFVQRKARGWKKTTIKAYGNSIRVFFGTQPSRVCARPG